MTRTPPHSFPRRILQSVTGLSSQVVTETLYALAVSAKQPFVATEIRLITTAEGAERARLSLLSEDRGWFKRIRDDYALPEIAFDSALIHMLRDAEGMPIADIRTPEDKLRCAEFITETVRAFTADSRAQAHVSNTDGRKTMDFFFGYAHSPKSRAIQDVFCDVRCSH